eukprot:TRINITY_DN5649_c0_g1_i1.p2 TRINITY_DN5649_c0_g1~~TRINITY_DN5649_c0_g1_i1.p2  ORF type:complete len:108 (-),score=0.28 TRINITY_DN5649_c0_g1_i1:119-442(-)
MQIIYYSPLKQQYIIVLSLSWVMKKAQRLAPELSLSQFCQIFFMILLNMSKFSILFVFGTKDELNAVIILLKLQICLLFFKCYGDLVSYSEQVLEIPILFLCEFVSP